MMAARRRERKVMANQEVPKMIDAKRIPLLSALTLTLGLLLAPGQASAHCQIPCGIYDDHARVDAMREDAATVAKAARLINELSAASDAQSQQQLVRWVMNKERHAQNIIGTISDYFLTQRVKPDQDDYAQRLQRHHAVILAAMKAKQSVSTEAAAELADRIEALFEYYPGE